MTLQSFKIALTAAITVAACLLLTAPTAMADKGACKLQGAWVAKVIGFPGQWSYVLAAVPSGRHAAGHGSVDVGFNRDRLYRRGEDRNQVRRTRKERIDALFLVLPPEPGSRPGRRVPRRRGSHGVLCAGGALYVPVDAGNGPSTETSGRVSTSGWP